jgi:hypothetical protein
VIKTKMKKTKERQRGDEIKKESRKLKKRKDTMTARCRENIGNDLLLVSAWGAENPECASATHECAKCYFCLCNIQIQKVKGAIL